eukprot:74468_1
MSVASDVKFSTNKDAIDPANITEAPQITKKAIKKEEKSKKRKMEQVEGHETLPTKKMKLNNDPQQRAQIGKQPDGLINELAFIQENGGKQSTHKIRITVPKDDSKKEFSFNGQALTIPMQLNQNIKELKQKINEVLSLPIQRQKLLVKGKADIWVKNANSLAFYNINADSVLTLLSRGPKKRKKKKRIQSKYRKMKKSAKIAIVPSGNKQTI